MDSTRTSHFDELQWIIQLRRALEEDLNDDSEIPVSIATVPKPLLCSNPECYVPQCMALGPYHHRRRELHDMERYKLAAARRVQQQLSKLEFYAVVELFAKLEYPIRVHYHRYLDYSGETLSWMMAIDASFLLDFFQIQANDEGQAYRQSIHNMILRDLLMLENQIPLFLIRKLLEIQHSSSKIADEFLSSILFSFLKEISPFPMIHNSPCVEIVHHSHLLEVIYYSIIPKDGGLDCQTNVDEDQQEQQEGSFSCIKSSIKLAGDFIFRQLRSLATIIIKFSVKIPWCILTRFPLCIIVKQPMENLLFSQIDQTNNTNDKNSLPSMEEIAIPSVTDLERLGITFIPTNGNVSSINFNPQTATLHLPILSLDMNSEVVLRNLVAYEATVVPGPLVFTRYIEFMNGMIDTEDDARILREKKVVVNRMKTDGEVADLWNGMSRSVKLTRVRELDRVIEDVNSYYNSRWRVKMAAVFRRRVVCSWLQPLGLFVVVVSFVITGFLFDLWLLS